MIHIMKRGKHNYVSTYGLQRKSNEGKYSSNEVAKSSRLRIEYKADFPGVITTLLIVERPCYVSGSDVDDAKGKDDGRFVDEHHDVGI